MEEKKPHSKWFGRGIYGSKDVPIRLLDGLIAVFLIAIVGMILYSTFNGGFLVTFDTDGGNALDSQKLRYGTRVREPELPIKPGYDFEGWYSEYDDMVKWNFAVDKVGGDITLKAKWSPAAITVKFDLNGGNFNGREEVEPASVIFLEPYGELPNVQMEGAVFGGWSYEGKVLTAKSQVMTTGEHVLTAVWE